MLVIRVSYRCGVAGISIIVVFTLFDIAERTALYIVNYISRNTISFINKFFPEVYYISEISW